MKAILYTTEAVSEGHPDKICDQISDAILDECLKRDNNSRVACEVMITYKKLIISGEISTRANIQDSDYEKVARDVLKKIGWTKRFGLDPDTFEIEILLNTQSKEISSGVNKETIGAGDQGLMYGYAVSNTHKNDYMPLSYSIAQELVRYASNLRREGSFKDAGPDMKAQVTIEGDRDSKEFKIKTILMSVQHAKDYNQKEFNEFITNNIINYVVNLHNLNNDFDIYINPAGTFAIGGPMADTGLTGRKIIVDTYGGEGRHGGGAFSGKDYTKMDRTGAYITRYIAKNIVASGIASKIEVQISYIIGKAKPISLNIDSFGTLNKDISYTDLIETVWKNIDLTPHGIFNHFNLKDIKYSDFSCYGHFGREDLKYTLPWEKLDKIDIFKKLLKN